MLIVAFSYLFAAASFVSVARPGAVAHAQAHQAGKIYRIGFLRAGQPPVSYIEGFRQGLQERGYVDGQNVVVEFRATDGSFDQLPRLAEELVRLKVDVILASAAPAALAIKRVTTSVPIVFVGVVDPVELGLVPSLGRPGSNITGLATTSADFAGKRLELLRATVPGLRRVAVLWHPANPTNPIQLKGAQAAARTLGLQLEPVSVQGRMILTPPSRRCEAPTVCYCWRAPFSRRIALASQSSQRGRGCLRSMARGSMSTSEASCHLARTFTTCTGVQPPTRTRS